MKNPSQICEKSSLEEQKGVHKLNKMEGATNNGAQSFGLRFLSLPLFWWVTNKSTFGPKLSARWAIWGPSWAAKWVQNDHFLSKMYKRSTKS